MNNRMSNHVDRNRHPLAGWNRGHQLDDVVGFDCDPKDTVGVISLGINRPSHHFLPGPASVSSCLPTVMVIQSNSSRSSESVGNVALKPALRGSAPTTLLHSAVVVEDRFLQLNLSSLVLSVITGLSLPIFHPRLVEITMRPFPGGASLEVRVDRRHVFRIKHAHVSGHEVVLGVIRYGFA